MVLSKLDQYRDHGLLLLRIGIGIMFICHGFPKLAGGPEKWAWLGQALPGVGPGTFATVMGFMAGMAEFGGGILLTLGLFTRIACFFMLNTMVVATIMHIRKGDSFTTYSHAAEAGILFLSMIIIGAGKFSLDEYLRTHCCCCCKKEEK